MKTTVICAAWHRDPNRYELVLQHFENLKSQSVPLDVVYIFDNGDSPPAEVRKNSVVINSPLTIYEAWNVGLSLVRTPYVMNLNLDDRLSYNAVELLQQEIELPGVTFVGGDWEIIPGYVPFEGPFESLELDSLPFNAAWPPISVAPTRLGSGDGKRGTYGPAVMWRMTNHLSFPRYPYRTVDGNPIRSIADSIWWGMLLGLRPNSGRRLPVIIGKYSSRPDNQAEFRFGSEAEEVVGKTISLL